MVLLLFKLAKKTSLNHSEVVLTHLVWICCTCDRAPTAVLNRSQAAMPPSAAWNVPHDGAIDSSFSVTPQRSAEARSPPVRRFDDRNVPSGRPRPVDPAHVHVIRCLWQASVFLFSVRAVGGSVLPQRFMDFGWEAWGLELPNASQATCGPLDPKIFLRLVFRFLFCLE